ncbi:uncharacterized protein VTP21DRAFT_1944 [Calcarisporiella thermophila]|uniref:uncharacterized protein n=1 Tax=Calcarisporiella thermophila TaxID=911321 RepID=UPI003743D7AB
MSTTRGGKRKATGNLIDIPTRPTPILPPQATPIAIPTTSQNANEESSSSSSKSRSSRPPPTLAELKTLEDEPNPQRPEYLDMAISHFCRDLKEGVVSSSFKARIEAQQRAEREKANGIAKTAGKEEEENASVKGELNEIKEDEDEDEDEANKSDNKKTEELPEQNVAVQVKLVDGKVVVDADSLTIDRERITRPTNTGPMELVEESDQNRFVNSLTYSKYKRVEKWTKEDHEKFYQGLSMFGTDFDLIARMFNNRRNRRQIRNKFKKEERTNPSEITAALQNRTRIDVTMIGLKVDDSGNVVMPPSPESESKTNENGEASSTVEEKQPVAEEEKMEPEAKLEGESSAPKYEPPPKKRRRRVKAAEEADVEVVGTIDGV